MRSVRLLRNDNVTRVFRPFWDSSRTHRFGGNSLISKNPENEQPDPYEGNFSFIDCDQFIKVTVVGAAGRVGKVLSLLLKTCPLVDHLCLFDTDKSVKGIGVDISHIDTKCCISYVYGMRNIQQALDAPDVVVIAAGCPTSPQLNGQQLFDKNAPIVAGLSEACARFCPKACIVLITSPINSLLPVMGEVYQLITNRIPSRKLFGLTMLDVVRANTFVAEAVRKDPNSIIVPVIGGTSQETIVPVISQMKPCCKIKRKEIIALTECIKQAEGHLSDCQNCGTPGASSLSTAYAAFRFTSSLIMALKGAEDIIECAFVKSDIIPELEYLASPLKLGIQGVEYNFGYPQLSDYELTGLEEAATRLLSDISMGKAFVSGIEGTIRKGLIWKRLSNEVEKTKLDENSNKAHPKEILEKMKKTKERRKRKDGKTEVAKDRVQLRNGAIEQSALVENLPMYSDSGLHARTSLNSLWFPPSLQESQVNCNQISADLGTCKDLEKHVDRHGEEIEEPSDNLMVEASNVEKTWFKELNLVPRRKPMNAVCRKFHTINKDNEKEEQNSRRKKLEKYKEYLMEDRKKTVIPAKVSKCPSEAIIKYKAKKIEDTSKKSAWNLKFKSAQYKLLNAAAKKKFRTFNVQKRFTPSASVLLLLDKKKRDRASKNLGLALNNTKEKSLVAVEEKELKEKEEEETEVEEKLSVDVVQNPNRTDSTKYKEFVLKQLQELKRENEELKKKLIQIAENKNLEKALQVQTDNLELERTKLRACWLIMTSTMDAFSNFCRKFTSKTDLRLIKAAKSDEDKEHESEEDEYQDAIENIETNSAEQKNEGGYDEKYYNFLEKLMEDQVGCEKSRKSMGK